LGANEGQPSRASATQQDAAREWAQTEGSSPVRLGGHKQGQRGQCVRVVAVWAVGVTASADSGMGGGSGPLKWAWRGTRKSRH